MEVIQVSRSIYSQSHPIEKSVERWYHIGSRVGGISERLIWISIEISKLGRHDHRGIMCALLSWYNHFENHKIANASVSGNVT